MWILTILLFLLTMLYSRMQYKKIGEELNKIDCDIAILEKKYEELKCDDTDNDIDEPSAL